MDSESEVETVETNNKKRKQSKNFGEKEEETVTEMVEEKIIIVENKKTNRSAVSITNKKRINKLKCFTCRATVFFLTFIFCFDDVFIDGA